MTVKILCQRGKSRYKLVLIVAFVATCAERLAAKQAVVFPSGCLFLNVPTYMTWYCIAVSRSELLILQPINQ